MGLAAALVAAQMAGAMVAVAPTRRPEDREKPIRLGVDPAGPDGDFSSAVLCEVDGDDVLRVRSALTSGPNVTSNRNPADLEALRAAQLRRERKAARQAKGFR